MWPQRSRKERIHFHPHYLFILYFKCFKKLKLHINSARPRQHGQIHHGFVRRLALIFLR
jgi:hypothetical protein